MLLKTLVIPGRDVLISIRLVDGEIFSSLASFADKKKDFKKSNMAGENMEVAFGILGSKTAASLNKKMV